MYLKNGMCDLQGDISINISLRSESTSSFISISLGRSPASIVVFYEKFEL